MPKMKPLKFNCTDCDCRFKARVSEKHINVVSCPQCGTALRYARDRGLPVLRVAPIER